MGAGSGAGEFAGRQVVVVEDDGFTRRAVCDVLADDGAEVAELASGDEFMAHAARSTDTPEVLMVDVNLGGGMTGFDVARVGRAKWPEVTVIYVTGDLRAVVKAVSGPRELCLLKPFTDDALRRIMRSVAVTG